MQNYIHSKDLEDIKKELEAFSAKYAKELDLGDAGQEIESAILSLEKEIVYLNQEESDDTSSELN